MSEPVAPWLRDISPGGRGIGFLHKFRFHALAFVDRGPRQLVVTFDNLAEMGNRTLERSPWSYDFFAERGASVLGVMARRGLWYRDPDLISCLTSLASGGFFQRFEKVLFTGNSMGGFGALTFAPLSPGADVLSFSPQTTLDKSLVPWETRFEKAWAADWSLDFSDAAVGAKSARRATIIYDPVFELDHRHAERLAGSNVLKLKAWYASHKSPVFLRRLDMLKPVSEAAMAGNLTESLFYNLYRRRRATPWYRQSLRRHAKEKNHPKFVARLGQLYGPIGKEERAAEDARWLKAGRKLQAKSRAVVQDATVTSRDLTVFVLTPSGDPFLARWLDYHTRFIPADRITLLSTDTSPQADINSLHIAGPDIWRTASVIASQPARSGQLALLLRSTEFLVAHADPAKNPFDLLAHDPRDHLSLPGIEIVHHRTQSAPLGPGQSLLAQRPTFRANSTCSRPVAIRSPVTWSGNGAGIDRRELHLSEEVMLFDIEAADHDLGCLHAASTVSRHSAPADLSVELDGVARLVPQQRGPFSYRVLIRLYANFARALAENPTAPVVAPDPFVFRKRLFELPQQYLALF